MPRLLDSYDRLLRRHLDGRRIAVLVLITLALYAYMLAISIPAVMSFAGGLKLFDMLPGGYTVEYAGQLLDRLGLNGRSAYLTHQLPVDMIYPGLFAVSYALLLAWVLRKAARRRPGELPDWIVWLSLVPVAAGLFDYLENLGIIGMILSFPNTPAIIVRLSSTFSVTKAVLTTAFFVALMGGGIAAAFRAFRDQSNTALRV